MNKTFNNQFISFFFYSSMNKIKKNILISIPLFKKTNKPGDNFKFNVRENYDSGTCLVCQMSVKSKTLPIVFPE